MTNQIASILHAILRYVMPGGRKKMTIQERRLITDRQAERFIHAPRGDRLEKIMLGKMPAEWHYPKNDLSQRVILYLHGGAYTFCSPATHRGLAGRIALASQAKTLVIAYRLAPENPFPAALEDALFTWQSLLDQKFSPGQIVIAGDSAGGGLTLATAMKLKELHRPLPAALVLLSPWVDLFSFPEYSKPYVGDADPRNPLISPLLGDLRDLPPTLIQAGGAEFLLKDSQQLEEAMTREKTTVRFSVYKGMNHVFQAFAPLVPAAKRAIVEIGEFIRAKTA